LVVLIISTKIYPLVASRGSAPIWGTGSRRWPWGAPPGGSPGPTRHRAPIMAKNPEKQALGGVPGGPLGGPRGGLCGAQGASGGGRGPLPGGYPPGGPLVAALPTDNTALLEPPPRGAPRGGPPGGPFWGVRSRWGQNQARSSLTVVSRGGRGAPPQAHWVRSLQGGPKRAPGEAFVGVFTPRVRAIAPCLSAVVFSMRVSAIEELSPRGGAGGGAPPRGGGPPPGRGGGLLCVWGGK
jgi:hypothetical protein